ncbi:hypothetical protein ACPPVO_22965 [Dactylosporangium sp. McL0621]|uniref:hypothetical protein n=1 Tax=Dactylosporangium sp. McL0621 TaxID=3415678 RepID=UPI003CE73688
MPTLSGLIHDGAVLTGAASTLYTLIVTTAALTALLARTPARRRDAQQVLKILLRRRDGNHDHRT